MNRLVWNSCGPLPYESSWSVFIKLIGWNVKTPLALYQCFNLGGRANRFSCDWVDLTRLAQLLNLEDDTLLRKGFISELGFPLPKGRTPDVRHCQQCLAMGFHSSLFETWMIKRCPWHGESLTSCVDCRRETAVSRSSSHRTCLHVRQLLACYTVHSPTRPLSPEFTQRVKECGDAFTSWWHLANEIDRKQGNIFENLPEILIPSEKYHLSHIVSHIGVPPIPLVFDIKPCSFMEFRAEEAGRLWDLTSSDFIASFKCLRRHLFKLFGSGHRQCFKRASRHRSSVILGRPICRVAAFLAAWEDIHEVRSSQFFPLRVRSIQPFDIPASRTALRILFANFVGTLREVCDLSDDQSDEIQVTRVVHRRKNTDKGALHPLFSLPTEDAGRRCRLVYPETSLLRRDVQQLPCSHYAQFEIADNGPTKQRRTPEIDLGR